MPLNLSGEGLAFWTISAFWDTDYCVLHFTTCIHSDCLYIGAVLFLYEWRLSNV